MRWCWWEISGWTEEEKAGESRCQQEPRPPPTPQTIPGEENWNLNKCVRSQTIPGEVLVLLVQFHLVPPLIDAFLCTRPLTRSLFNCIRSWGLNTGENENDQTMFKQEWTCSFKLCMHLWIPCWWIIHVFEILSTFVWFCFILPQQRNNYQRGRFCREEKYLAQ